MVSGLRVNIAKSEILLIGVVDNVDRLASAFGCKISALPSSYLGLPIGAPFKNKAMWTPIIERFDWRLTGWKKQLLSKAGRLTLIKSTLSSLPTYFLSVFVMPASVRNRLEMLERDFLWEGQGEERKYHLVKWDKVCSVLRVGGLGLKRFSIFNSALLGKWLWRFMSENYGLWKRVVVCKYRVEEVEWYPKIISRALVSGVWKGIGKGWDPFVRQISFEIGNGSKVRFWKDKWCGEVELWRLFPDLFSVAAEQDVLVSEVLKVEHGNVVWSPNFRRNLQYWEMESCEPFFAMLYAQQVDCSREGSVRWSASITKKILS